MIDDRAAVAKEWDKYSVPRFLDPLNLGYGEYFFTPLELFYKRELDRLPVPTGRTLDVGCGNGHKLMYLLKRGTATRGAGIDISEGAIVGAARVRAHLGVSSDRVTVKVAAFEDFPVAEPFDLILAIQIVNFHEDVDAFMDAIRAHCAPGARVVVSDVQNPSSTILQGIKGNRIVRRIWNKPPLAAGLRHHSCRDVVSAATRAGLLLDRVAYANHFWSRVVGGWMHRSTTRRIPRSIRRSLVRRAYVAARGIWTFEDRMRRHADGAVYVATFRRP